MVFAGIMILLTAFGIIFVVAQVIFYKHTGRGFWRAFLPMPLRRMILPEDRVLMNSSAVLEEFIALSLTGSFCLLPTIFVHAVGLLELF